MTAKPSEVVEFLRARFEATPEHRPLPSALEDMLMPLESPLLADDPRHSQAAEAALVILAFSLVEERVLDLSRGSGDVSADTGRIRGDRTAGDQFCERVLAPRSIPATKGPFQSSTWRSGYDAAQARDAGLGNFIDWHKSASLADLDHVCDRLVASFLGAAATVAPLPRIDASLLTFGRFRSFLDLLFTEKSGGAFEQYCFAALLELEMATTGKRGRVVTKSVRSSDAATKSAGDVVVHRGGRVAEAYEVTARPWKSKLSQLSTSARAGLTEVSIVATGVAGTLRGEDLEAELAVLQAELAVDVSVLDLMGTLDLFSARLGRFERADAIRRVYANLVQWHRREPHLVAAFVECLKSISLDLDDGRSEEEGPDVEDSDLAAARELVARLHEQGSDGVVRALLQLASDEDG